MLFNTRNVNSSTTLYNVICSLTDANKSIIERIDEGRKYIFNFEYTTPDNINADEFKQMFENAFISEYITRYIAYETFELFQLKLRGKLQTVMLDYNKKLSLYFDENFNGTDTNVTESEGGSKNINAELPVGIINANKIADVNKASSGNMNENKNKTTQKHISVDSLMKSSDYFNGLFRSLILEFSDMFQTVVCY